ncbi:MAG: outer membrane protein assembly factor BamB [Pseudomonadota bacterium]|nr:outer membrane protein assembly factor BamB [Pseudomonadota bacterium]
MTRRSVELVTTCCVAYLLAGCAMFAWLPFVDPPEPDSDEIPSLVSFEKEADIVRLWSASVGKGLGRKYLRLAPALAGDRIFAADAYGAVEARNRFDGAVIWTSRIGAVAGFARYKFWDRKDPSFVTGGVGTGNGLIFLGTTAGEIVALNISDGSEVWRIDVSSEVLAPPIGQRDTVVLQTSDGKLVALEHSNGAKRWTFDTQVPILTLRGTATPVLEREVVFAGFSTGMIAAVDLKTGAPVWEQRVMLPQGRSELERMVDVDGSPLYSGNMVYAVSYQGRLKAIRASDGAVVWEIEASSYLDPAEGYGQVYVVTDKDVIMAVDQQQGQIVWQQEGLRNRVLSSPLAFGNYIVVADDQGYVHVIAQSDGRFVARRKIGGGGARSAMVQRDGTVYVQTNKGRLVALEIRRG